MNTYIGCSVIIYNQSGNVLIAKRSSKKKQFPLMWETIGGALEDNETPEECIRRETSEEIGCNLLDLRLFKVYVVTEEDNRYVHIVFMGRIEGPIKLNYEIEETRWIYNYQLDDYDFCTLTCKRKISDFYNECKNRGVLL